MTAQVGAVSGCFQSRGVLCGQFLALFLPTGRVDSALRLRSGPFRVIETGKRVPVTASQQKWVSRPGPLSSAERRQVGLWEAGARPAHLQWGGRRTGREARAPQSRT